MVRNLPIVTTKERILISFSFPQAAAFFSVYETVRLHGADLLGPKTSRNAVFLNMIGASFGEMVRAIIGVSAPTTLILLFAGSLLNKSARRSYQAASSIIPHTNQKLDKRGITKGRILWIIPWIFVYYSTRHTFRSYTVASMGIPQAKS